MAALRETGSLNPKVSCFALHRSDGAHNLLKPQKSH